MRTRPALIIFARAPLPGETKTRLIPALGAEGAAELYGCFLRDAFVHAAGLDADVFLAAAEPAHLPALTELLHQHCPHAAVTVQSGATLGERMLNAFRKVLRAGYPAAVIVGTDLPSLPWIRVAEALAWAPERDVVLGPCLDGGYYLVGLHAVLPRLFENVAWSTRDVLVETLRRSQRLRLNVMLLEPWYDVDTPYDLEVLRSHLTALALSGEEVPCPWTWQYLFTHPEAG